MKVILSAIITLASLSGSIWLYNAIPPAKMFFSLPLVFVLFNLVVLVACYNVVTGVYDK